MGQVTSFISQQSQNGPFANCILQKSQQSEPKVDLLVRVAESVHFNASGIRNCLTSSPDLQNHLP